MLRRPARAITRIGALDTPISFSRELELEVMPYQTRVAVLRLMKGSEMATEIILPSGAHHEDGTVIVWHKAEGDRAFGKMR